MSALIDTFAPGEPEPLRAMLVRFGKSVLPDETTVAEFFEADDAITFRSRLKDRDAIALDQGKALIVS
jgi:hypothetical protein